MSTLKKSNPYFNCWKYSIISFLCVLSININALEPIDVSNLEHYQTTTDHYQYFQDPSLKLSIEDAAKSNKWKDTEPGVTNRGFTKNNSWMRFQLDNPSSQDVNIILEYVDPAVVSLDMYTKNSNNDFQALNFTFNKPVKSRPVAHFKPAFPLTVEANTTAEVYMRVVPGNKFAMHSFTSMRIWEAQNFQHSTNKELSLLLILICTEIFMGIATLVLFVLIRKRVFLYYAFFVFSAASLFAAFSGLWSYFIAQNHYEIWMVVLQIGICQVATFLFVREFLNTKVHLPKADIFLQAIIALNIFGLILNLFGQPSFSRVIIDYTAVAYVLLIPIGLAARKKGVPHSLLFTVSWVIFIIGMAFASMRLRGYIDDSLLAQNLIYIGGFIEVSLLTTVMVLTVDRLQKEKQLLESRYRKSLEESADKLTLKVNQQTQELKLAKEKAETEARIDILTGINNRRAFMETVKQYIDRAKRNTDSKLYLALIDIDHFKQVNDTHGHSAGDKVLQAIASSLKKTIRSTDSVSRIGGEEFALLMQSENQKGILELCNRLRTSIENLVSEFDKQKIRVTISIGLAEFDPLDSLDSLLQKSDKALYLAKIQGRNQVIVFH